MGDAGIKSAIQGSNVPNPDEAVPSFVSGAMAKACKVFLYFMLHAATTDIYTLSLHDALPIYWDQQFNAGLTDKIRLLVRQLLAEPARSEEHTSELQSHSELVCRLLLEKKKTIL